MLSGFFHRFWQSFVPVVFLSTHNPQQAQGMPPYWHGKLSRMTSRLPLPWEETALSARRQQASWEAKWPWALYQQGPQMSWRSLLVCHVMPVLRRNSYQHVVHKTST